MQRETMTSRERLLKALDHEEPTRAVGLGRLFFPMVKNIGPASDLGLPDSATGRELMENGLTVKPGASPA